MVEFKHLFIYLLQNRDGDEMKRKVAALVVISILVTAGCVSQKKEKDTTESGSDTWWSILKETNLGEVTILTIEWTPGVFEAYMKKGAGEYVPYDLVSQYTAEVFLPHTENANMVVFAAHTEDAVMRVSDKEYAQIARDMRTIVVVYGEKSSDWETLGFTGRNHLLMGGLFLVMREDSGGVRGDFASWLNHTMERAIDLGIAVAERYNIHVGRIGVMGGSKEGLATWSVCVEDSRVFAAAPGRFRYEDVEAAVEEGFKEWGCGNPNPAWVQVEGFLHPRDLLTLMEYAKSKGLEDRIFLGISHKIDGLKPTFLLIYGNVNTAETHDGKYFPLLGENAFLEALKEKGKKFRYIRDSPGEDRSESVLRALVTVLCYPEISEEWPQVTDTAVTVEKGYLKVAAEVEGSSTAVTMAYGVSSDTAWNNGDEQWKTIPMTFSEGKWRAQVKVDPKKAYAVYVDIYYKNKVHGYPVELYDASPFTLVSPFSPQSCNRADPRFINEYLGKRSLVFLLLYGELCL